MKTRCNMKSFRLAAFAVFAAFTMLLGLGTARAQSPTCMISLTPGTPAPLFVGDRVVWTATATSCGASPVYQFRVASPSAADNDEDNDRSGGLAGNDDRSNKQPQFRMVRDFSPANSFAWATLHEGSYQVMVSVKDGFDAVNSTSAVISTTVNSRVIGASAVVTPTLNPLVALYSAPTCEHGTIHVKFRPVASTNEVPWTTTNSLPCLHHQSRNFLIAGMLPHTPYEMVHVASDNSPSLIITTGTLPPALNFPVLTVRQPPSPGSDLTQAMVFNNFTGRPAPNAVNVFATDLSGRIKWYYDALKSGLSNGAPGVLEPGGTVSLLGRDSNRKLGFNVLRQVDLAGNPIQETNIDAVNAQLKVMGQRIIFGFHHEILRLPDERTATLGWNLRTIDVNGTPTPYVGINVIVLDKDFQVVWVWDAFEHLDVHRGPILDDKCTGAPCPVPGAVDWLHANAIARSPEDGNLIISVRHQAWVIKIDYRHGRGDGHIIWRLGKEGEFVTNSTDPNPWFSYQHNVHYLDRKTLLLFDNGNVRCFDDENCHSRGQTWIIDEEKMAATPGLNVDLGNFSDALGSAETLPNGNFVFTSGSQGTDTIFGQSIEIRPDGTKEFVLEGAALLYRSYRVADLYRGIRR